MWCVLHLTSPLAATFSPVALSSCCHPKAIALGQGLKLGLEDLGTKTWDLIPLKNTHGWFFQRPGILTELSRNSNGLLGAQVFP